MVGCLCFLTHGSSSGSERIVIYPLHNSVAVGSVGNDPLQTHYIGFENTVHLRMNPLYLSESD